jgi:hypothetical protein
MEIRHTETVRSPPATTDLETCTGLQPCPNSGPGLVITGRTSPVNAVRECDLKFQSSPRSSTRIPNPNPKLETQNRNVITILVIGRSPPRPSGGTATGRMLFSEWADGWAMVESIHVGNVVSYPWWRVSIRGVDAQVSYPLWRVSTLDTWGKVCYVVSHMNSFRSAGTPAQDFCPNLKFKIGN